MAMNYRSAEPSSNVAVVLAILYLFGGFGTKALTVTVGDLTVDAGENVTLQCSFTTTATSPVRTLTWSFTSAGSSTEQNFYSMTAGAAPTIGVNYTDRVVFDGPGDLSTGQANLQLLNVQESDEGTYGCDVFVFTDGSDKGTFQLDVIVPTTAAPSTVPRTASETTKAPDNNKPKDNSSLIAGTVAGASAGTLIIIGTIVYVIRRKKKGCMKIKLHPMPGQKVEVQWTEKAGASYKVVYRPKGSSNWTEEPEMSRGDSPNYKHVVHFPQDGIYEVCVLVNDEKGDRKSDIMEVEVSENAAPKSRSESVSPLHGNNAPKSDVVFVKEGQSQQVKLAPIVIDKQKPTEKKKKKKKKGKKVNKVNASDEDIKPED